MFIIRQYSLGSVSPIASTDAMAMHRLFQKQGVLRVESIPDLVHLLFEDMRFVRYARIGYWGRRRRRVTRDGLRDHTREVSRRYASNR